MAILARLIAQKQMLRMSITIIVIIIVKVQIVTKSPKLLFCSHDVLHTTQGKIGYVAPSVKSRHPQSYILNTLKAN